MLMYVERGSNENFEVFIITECLRVKLHLDVNFAESHFHTRIKHRNKIAIDYIMRVFNDVCTQVSTSRLLGTLVFIITGIIAMLMLDFISKLKFF